LALCITLSYIIPITGISWGIRDRNHEESREVQGGMLEGALVPDGLSPRRSGRGRHPGAPTAPSPQRPPASPRGRSTARSPGLCIRCCQMGFFFGRPSANIPTLIIKHPGCIYKAGSESLKILAK